MFARPTLAILALLALAGSAAAAEPPLIQAAKLQDTAAVRKLLAAGADASTRQGDGATPLHWAAHRDNADIARLLLAARAGIDDADDLGVTPLSLACLNGSTPMVRLLLDAKADPNAARATGETPLMTAARVGNAEVVKLLLAAGATINTAENFRGQTALMLAVAENHPAVVRELIAAGADVKQRSKNRFTPLLFAAQQGSVEIARMLLEAGADVNETAPDGIAGDTNARSMIKPNTEAAALLVAIDSHHPAMVLFLLDAGADVNHHGAGRTALHSAVQQALPEVVQALLARGANVNARLEKAMPQLSRFIRQDTGVEPAMLGATPFWLAASYCDTRIMRLLIAGGADPKVNSNDGSTPLMVAAGLDFVDGQDKYGRRSYLVSNVPFEEAARDAVQLCLDLGLDINAVNNKGQTALHGSVYLGGTLLVECMVDKGAKIDAINKRGQTPWLITQGQYFSGSFYVHKDTGELLEKLGADTKLGKDLGPNFSRRGRAPSANAAADPADPPEDQ